MIYCPNCEKATQENISVKDEASYRITTTKCSICNSILVLVMRLIKKVEKNT